jgi:hypothetical protein
MEPYCKQFVLSDQAVVKRLLEEVIFESSYYNNLRWGYPYEYWLKKRHLFNPTDHYKRIFYSQNPEIPKGDIIVKIKYSELVDQWSSDVQKVIENINQIVDMNDIGDFEFGPLKISIQNKNNLMNNYKRINNLSMLLKDQEFKFV